ncbi:MAG: hypothetical protein HY790_10265 [Deltaproteobacteria bacterium]|nr:hypothetical protein [Deltaproteobacteria bacterium]
MEGSCSPAAGGGYRWLGAGEERLDRALVAGLMLDAALGASPWPPDLQAQSRALKIRVQEALLFHLAGRITLDRFRTLIHTLERSFSFYFPLLTSLLPHPDETPAPPPAATQAAHDAFPGSRAVSRDLLAGALGRLQNILPRRPRSKLTGPKLHDFLCRTRGVWFRLRDFQEYFSVDRKTAWEYVQKFLQAGLLVHNQARAAAVRYGLADRFLKVQAGAIHREVAAALADLPSPLASQVADRLIASAGEPFWEEEWRCVLPAAHFPEILQRLTGPASLLEVVCSGDGKNRLLRLQPRWLNPLAKHIE